MRIRTEERRYIVLKKMGQIGKPCSILEIGFNATPEVVRNMAAGGLLRVTVEMTDRGREALAKETAKRLRAYTNAEKAFRISESVF